MKSLLPNLGMQNNVSINVLRKIGLFGLVFGLVKINSVSSVFILANQSPSMAIFGMIDYALALGLILAVPANMGLTGAYPYFILNQKEKGFESIFFFHAWILSSVFLLFYGALLLFDVSIGTTVILTLVITVVFALQILASVMLKSKEQIFFALAFEAGFFLLLNAYNLYLFLAEAKLQVTVLQNCIVIYLLLLNFYFFDKIKSIRQVNWGTYRQILNFGWPLVTTALLIMLLTGSARIVIERFIGMEAVGIYGLYFRLAALVVLLYQVVNIVFFKKIYTSKPKELDRWFQVFLFFIALIGLVFFIAIPVVVLPFVEIIKNSWSLHSSLYAVLIFQMFFWIALALFENIIYRENLSRPCNTALFFLLFVMLLILLVCHHCLGLTVTILAGVNVFILYFACEWMMKLMTVKDIYFPRTKRLLRCGILIFAAYFFIISLPVF